MSTKTHYIDGDNYQLRQIIFANTPKAIQQCKSIAPKFKGATEMDTCRNIFDFLKNDIKYVADGSHQKVKLPSALLRERVGDCKSYSLVHRCDIIKPWHSLEIRFGILPGRPHPHPYLRSDRFWHYHRCSMGNFQFRKNTNT
jgi:hypothetical protein